MPRLAEIALQHVECPDVLAESVGFDNCLGKGSGILETKIEPLARDRMHAVRRIADQGSHEELIARPGLYQRIHFIQSGLEDEFILQAQSEAQEAVHE